MRTPNYVPQMTVYSLLSSKTAVNSKKHASISVKGQTTWMFGELNNWDSFSLNRLNLGLTFYYHPKFLEDVGLFAKCTTA